MVRNFREADFRRVFCEVVGYFLLEVFKFSDVLEVDVGNFVLEKVGLESFKEFQYFQRFGFLFVKVLLLVFEFDNMEGLLVLLYSFFFLYLYLNVFLVFT